MTSSSPALAPLHHETAEHLAAVALRSPARTVVGPRVLEALLARIAELELSRSLLRRELDGLAARAQEDARLRAHALMVGQQARGRIASLRGDTEGAG